MSVALYLWIGAALASLYFLSILFGALTGELHRPDFAISAGVGAGIVLGWPLIIIAVITIATWDMLREKT